MKYLKKNSGLVLLGVGIALICLWTVRVSAMHVYEDAMFAIEPSAQRAFLYGEKYFNAQDPQRYDIARAEYYFNSAARIDPNIPYLQHELARVAFLRNDLTLALTHINTEIAMHAQLDPNAYYVRGLILGYQGRYLDAAADYETYFKLQPANWAGINDYSWVLLKAGLPQGAHKALAWGIQKWPDNAWLLSNDAIALYELGQYSEAKAIAQRAKNEIEKVSMADWLMAYPGNDPLAAPQGIDQFKKSANENLNKILVAK